jgi:hypothetical protein
VAQVNGLAVIVVHAATSEQTDEQPDVPATVWSLRSGRGDEQLRVLVDSSPVDPEGYWVIGDEWIFVEKADDQDAPRLAKTNLTRSRVGQNWRYNWADHVDALLVVLPPASGAAQADPPPRAQVKKGRLILWFTRPEIAKNNWVASWQTYSVSSEADLRRIAAELNDAYQGAPPQQREARDVQYTLTASAEDAPSAKRLELHGLPIVAWFAFVVTVSGVLVSIAEGVGPKLLVLGTGLLSGGFVFVAYRQGAGRARRIFYTVAAIASLCLAVAIPEISGVARNSPASPPQATTSTVSATRSSTSTTTTGTTTPDLPALPPRPPVETDIVDANTAEFFDGELIIGGGGAGIYLAALNLTTHEIGCTNVYFRVGEEKIIIGKRADGHDFFRITLLKVADKSATVRVEELPPKEWPAPVTRADDSTYYIASCPS